MLISLSLSMMSSRCSGMTEVVERFEREPVCIAASPTHTAIRCPRAASPARRRSRAAASPTPMLTPVPACPPSKTS